jgi:hypothetical protein
MAIFPTAISTDSDLFVAVNMVSTQLTDNPLTIGATTVNVVDASAFPSVGYLSIDNEIIKYAAKTATSFTSCTRSADGSVAAAHVQNSQIFHNVIAAHHNALKEEIKAVEQNISDRLGLGSTQLKATDGTISLPAISFASDPDTGIYHDSANSMAVTIGGTGTATFRSTFLYCNTPVYVAPGSASAPGLVFNSDTNTGIYSGGTDVLSFSVGGVSAGRVSATNWEIDVPFWAPIGSAAAPSISFGADPDTGIYRMGVNDLGVAVGGTTALEISTTKLISSVLFLAPDGSATVPSYSFGSDQDTGMYRASANNVSFAAGGEEVGRFYGSANISAAQTNLLIYCKGNANSVQQVLLGAADSAGSGYRTLRVPN